MYLYPAAESEGAGSIRAARLALSGVRLGDAHVLRDPHEMLALLFHGPKTIHRCTLLPLAALPNPLDHSLFTAVCGMLTGELRRIPVPRTWVNKGTERSTGER